ncbi:DNA/RNA non-specific endonuclease, partial [Heyndrickxia coagulans]
STAHKSVDMAKYMGLAVQKAFERDVIHGDAKSRTEFFTYGLASIGISLLGDKGLSKLGTAAKVAKTGNLAEKAGKLKVNTGFAPELEAAGRGTTYKIPFNALHHYKENILKIVEEQFSTVKYGGHYTKVNRKKALKSNVQYTTSQGYKYITDELGRIIDVEAKLELGNAKRNTYAQRIVGGDDRLANDDGGHLIASIFDGSGEIDNLVAMNARINRSEYKIIEGRWKKALLEGKSVKVNIKPLYKGESLRPVEFKISYTIDDKLYSDRLTNYTGGKK